MSLEDEPLSILAAKIRKVELAFGKHSTQERLK